MCSLVEVLCIIHNWGISILVSIVHTNVVWLPLLSGMQLSTCLCYPANNVRLDSKNTLQQISMLMWCGIIRLLVYNFLFRFSNTKNVACLRFCASFIIGEYRFLHRLSTLMWFDYRCLVGWNYPHVVDIAPIMCEGMFKQHASMKFYAYVVQHCSPMGV